MTAGYVPSGPLSTLYTNTTAGTVASPDAVDGAIQAIVQTTNDNYDAANTTTTSLATHKSEAELDHPNSSVTTQKIKDANVTTAKVADNAITTAKVADIAVTNSKLADLSVSTAKLQDFSVTSGKLADSSVTPNKIPDQSITTSKLGLGSVTTDRITNSAVGASQLDPALLQNFGDIAVQAEFDRRGLNVMKFGAKGDGSTDDTAAWQSALNVTGGVIIVPDGTYKITGALIVNTGSPKRIIGTGKSVLSVSLPSNTTLFSLFDNVSFENITLDFNNNNVKYGFHYHENLGVISIKNVIFRNIKDLNNAYVTAPVMIESAGNSLDLNGITIENALKYTTGTEESGVVNGALEGIWVNVGSTLSPISGGSIRNVIIRNFHNVDLSGTTITSIAANGIYLAMFASANKEANVFIDTIYGYNFGKRLLKTQASGVRIQNIYAESSTDDVLVAVGIQGPDNTSVKNVTLRGKMKIGISCSSTNTLVENVNIDITPASLQGSNSFGIWFSEDNVTIDGATIKADYGITPSRAYGLGLIKNTNIINSTITIAGNGLAAIEYLQGFEGFENLRIDNLVVIRLNNSVFALTFNQSNTASKNLSMTNITLIDNTATTNTFYGVYASNVTGILYDNFVHINNGAGNVFRTANHISCFGIRVRNCALNALANSASLAFTNCSGLSFVGITGNTASPFWVSVTNGDANLGTLPAAKVTLNDAAARNTSFFTQNFTIDTTSNRPTTTVAGQQHYDTTLNKPIWRNSSNTAWLEPSLYVGVPASATAAGIAGNWSADASFLYICHAANTWKRVAIATW